MQSVRVAGLPAPTPEEGEVLIRIEAVGLNFADAMLRRGDDYPEPSPTPFTLGAEVAGTIAALPDLIQSTLGEIIGYIMAGKLSLQVGTVLPLSQAAEAHRLLEGRQTTGKVVLQPWLDREMA